MSGTTISSSYVSGVTLANAGANNPVTILAGVTISDPTFRAVYGSGTIDWTISNAGTALSHGTSAHSYGVALGGGTITNVAGGLISGGYGGVAIYTAGTVINRGTIESAIGSVGGAVVLFASGVVANGVGAVISGAESGIGVHTLGEVVNNGTVQGLNGSGIVLTGGGAVSNGASATLTGHDNGAELQAAGAVTNSGTVTGSTANGVWLTAGGTVANYSGGTITGYRTGVSLDIGGTVINQGTIIQTGTAGYGYTVSTATSLTTLFDAGVLVTVGDVENGTAGVIDSYFFGIAADNAISMVNQGQITGSSTKIGFGVFLLGGGSISNAASGTIFGGLDGVLLTGGSASTMRNQGRISASHRAGVDFFAGGSYGSNAASGTIDGFLGVLMRGTGQMINAGSIGGTQYGIDLVGVGTVTNAASAHISGTAGVFELAGGTVVNQGVITSAGGAARGIYLAEAGYVSNAVTGTIASAGTLTVVTSGTVTKTLTGAGILMAGGAGTVMNAGSISSTETAGGSGIRLIAGGVVTNAASGTITSATNGIVVANALGTAVNFGRITGGQVTGDNGIYLAAGGTVSNALYGNIDAGTGILVAYKAGTVTNYGSILTTERYGGAGIELKVGGTVTNEAGASVNSQFFGVQIYGSGTVMNAGTIVADDAIKNFGAGVWVKGPAMVSNASSGTIGLGLFGVVFYNTSTLINSGAIMAQSTAVTGKAGYSVDVIVTPGATFTGVVDGGNALTSTIASVLDLRSGAGIGTIAGLGSKYIDFQQVTIDAGASWLVGGAVSAAQTVSFGGVGTTLTLGNPGSIAGVIDGFSAHDTIVLAGVTGVSSATLDAHNLLTVVSGSGPDLTFQFDKSQTFTFTNFDFVANGNATDLTLPCFATGTRIATPAGEMEVERLCVGDRVLTRQGARRAIIWLGHRRIDCRRHKRPADLWPVRVRAGAFGAGMPHRDLLLSPDHAVFVDAVLIPIRYLINHATIVQEAVDSVTYWHVELAEHEVLLAEGLSCESFLDTGNRGAFANGGVEVHMNPDFALKVWKVSACAPLVVQGPELAAARLRLLERAAALGHATTTDAALRVVVDGCELAPGSDGRFLLPAAARQMRLCSRSAVPAQLQHDGDDHRRLGVAVARIVFDGEPIALDDRRLSAGWHRTEPGWRWTDGEAVIEVAGVRELGIEIAMTGRYWVAKDAAGVTPPQNAAGPTDRG